jgi:hypothetical protein
MESIQPLPSRDPIDAAPPAPPELVVQNGRQSGTRRPLSQPLTLIGQAGSCNFRLNARGVGALHCALIQAPQGLLLRDLQSQTGTLVNGVAVATCLLRDNDELAIGPFRFRVRLPECPPGPGATPTPEELTAHEQQRDEALRTQAAAVAAQQAALTEEEGRLQQRRLALEQQEKQLAAHLEDRRRQLLQLQDEIRQARGELDQQRRCHEEQAIAAAAALARERAALEEGRRQASAERGRLVDLRRRLKQRWHRHWMAERRAQRQREDALAGQGRGLDKQGERLQQEKAALAQERLRCNGEWELARRQLQDERERLSRQEREWQQRRTREQADLQERGRQLDQRQAELARAERELEGQQQRWQGTRLHLEQEVAGLENRIRNHRRKILEQEQEAGRQGTQLPDRSAPAEEGVRESADGSGGAGEGTSLVGPAVPDSSAAPDRADGAPRECRRCAAEAEVQRRVTALEQLAGELADQRLHLTEQWQRLLLARRRWQEEQDAAVSLLEPQARRLREQEQAVAARAEAVGKGEAKLRTRLSEVVHLRHNLEGCQVRFRARVADWEGERERLLTEVRVREDLVERRLQLVAAVRGRWEKRRRQELQRLQAALAAAAATRQDGEGLRRHWVQRHAALERQERDLAEKSLALEQSRQECIGQSADSPAVEKHLERLRRHWADLSAAGQRAIARERQALVAEIAQFEDRCRQFQQGAREVAAAQAKLADAQTGWEQEQALMNDKHDRLRQELHSLHAQRRAYEAQLEQQRELLEQVARLLLDESETGAEPVAARAA